MALFGGYNPYQQALQQQYQQLAQNMQAPQSGGFIRVQNEEQAREWHVAPGGSITFIDENAPYCYTKSMGLSQFDSPVFKKFKLVEEAISEPRKAPNLAQGENPYNFITPDEWAQIKGKIKQIEQRLEAIQHEPVNVSKTDPSEGGTTADVQAVSE